LSLFLNTFQFFGGKSLDPENPSIHATPRQHVALVHGHLDLLESPFHRLYLRLSAEALLVRTFQEFQAFFWTDLIRFSWEMEKKLNNKRYVLLEEILFAFLIDFQDASCLCLFRVPRQSRALGKMATPFGSLGMKKGASSLFFRK
jgi:hypothetical protein